METSWANSSVSDLGKEASDFRIFWKMRWLILCQLDWAKECPDNWLKKSVSDVPMRVFQEEISIWFNKLSKRSTFTNVGASLIAQLVKNPPAMQETLIRFLGWEDLLEKDRLPTPVFLGFPCGSAGKESVCNMGDLGWISGLGRYPEEGKGYPLQYSGLENSMECIVTKSRHCWTHFTFTFTSVGRHNPILWGPEWNKRVKEGWIFSLYFLSWYIYLFLLLDIVGFGSWTFEHWDLHQWYSSSQAFGPRPNYTTGFPGCRWQTVGHLRLYNCMSQFLFYISISIYTSLIPQLVKNPPAIQETLVQFLGQEDSLEKGKATHFSMGVKC